MLIYSTFFVEQLSGPGAVPGILATYSKSPNLTKPIHTILSRLTCLNLYIRVLQSYSSRNISILRLISPVNIHISRIKFIPILIHYFFLYTDEDQPASIVVSDCTYPTLTAWW